MLTQAYNRYTTDDHEVWKLLFERQCENLRGNVWSRFYDCLELSNIHAQAVPDFRNINIALQQQTGWSIEVVKGIIPVDEFIPLLHRRRFCSSTWLRRRDQLDYLEEPDMFHDVFGHIPLLADKTYAEFVERFAHTGMKYLDRPDILQLLDRFYWFTIEFGLVHEAGTLRIYGAGLISSSGETRHALSGNVTVKPFDVATIIRTPFRNDEVQQLYFAAANMQQVWDSSAELEMLLEKAATNCGVVV
jgi:phenylalanine-4-hydroxylase